jgi:type I restriction-modification system DNA methylase subunit
MNINEQKRMARDFIKRWENKGNERKDSQPFWLDLLQSVYGIENPSEYITFEDSVMLDHTSFIDGYISKTKVMIEQKGVEKDLNKGIRQSDGSYLTPFQQAKRYSANLAYSQRPRWIVTSNFKEFYVYDMEKPNSEAVVVQLSDLEKEFYRLEFLVDRDNEHIEREMKVSMKAGEIVGEVYNALLKQYINPESPESLHAINQLIVRLVFCFYAEDAGLFGHKAMFHDYLSQFDSKQFRRALMDLFEILNTQEEERDPYLDDRLLSFPYVNGGMFSESNLEIPNFTDELRQLILDHASSNFDWSEISPTIFGAVFESTLNPETRRKGGMHYTSIENIHKVIDPLFLDDLKEELNDLRKYKQPSVVTKKAKQFQSKLASLVFLDPACGSGNFLTETYISVRRLENEAIKLYKGDEVVLDIGEELVKVHLNQFYGIEINDFAVSVAKTALWIAESQMLEATKEIVFANIDFLPLKSYTHIVTGNALTLDWGNVAPRDKVNYIIGNPPFLGFKYTDKQQKEDMKQVFGKDMKTSLLDYVSSWFKKSAEFIEGNTEVALVATNSISQGKMASDLWGYLLSKYGININFAYRPFIWKSEAHDRANVHVVIISFSLIERTKKYLFDSDSVKQVSSISPYLIEGSSLTIKPIRDPLSDIPKIIMGNQAMDDGNLIIEKDDYENFIKREPKAKKYIKRYMMGREFLNNSPRWCLWLDGISPTELRNLPLVYNRVLRVKQFRESSNDPGARKKAETPHLFREQRNPNNFIAIPIVSSERRRYIPMDFLNQEVIVGNKLYILETSDLYYFGVLMSNVHNSWMRTVAGRLKSDYTYSKDIVYNNFPWMNVDEKIREKISKTGQLILDARALYPSSSLADLYDELAMPVELRKAHQANDKAVMEAYGMTKTVNGKKTWLSESETVAKLFGMYEKLATK